MAATDAVTILGQKLSEAMGRCVEALQMLTQLGRGLKTPSQIYNAEYAELAKKVAEANEKIDNTKKNPVEGREGLLKKHELMNQGHDFYNAGNAALTARFEDLKKLHDSIIELQDKMRDPNYIMLDESTRNAANAQLRASLTEYNAQKADYQQRLSDFVSRVNAIDGTTRVFNEQFSEAISAPSTYNVESPFEQNLTSLPVPLPPAQEFDPLNWNTYSLRSLGKSAEVAYAKAAAPMSGYNPWITGSLELLKNILTPAEQDLLKRDAEYKSAFEKKYLDGTSISSSYGNLQIQSAPLDGLAGAAMGKAVTNFVGGSILHGIAQQDADDKKYTLTINELPTQLDTANKTRAFLKKLPKLFENATGKQLELKVNAPGGPGPMGMPQPRTMDYETTLQSSEQQFAKKFGYVSTTDAKQNIAQSEREADQFEADMMADPEKFLIFLVGVARANEFRITPEQKQQMEQAEQLHSSSSKLEM